MNALGIGKIIVWLLMKVHCAVGLMFGKKKRQWWEIDKFYKLYRFHIIPQK